MFTEFLSQNIYLVFAFVVLFNLLILTLLQSNIKGVTKISALALPKLLRDGKSTIIDIRKKTSFDAGHIAKSINIPMDDLKNDNKHLNKALKNPIILVCDSGSNSLKAAKKLSNMDPNQLFILDGGLINWQKENLPVSTS